MNKYKIIILFLFIFLVIIITKSCNSDYIIQEGKVFYRFYSFGQGGWNKYIIENTDSKTFEKIDSDIDLYGKDKLNVYFKNKIISGADPNTFKYIQEGYAVDKNRAYYYNDSIESSSPKNFEIIDGYFSKDFKDVYYENKPLNVCSVKNFEFLFKDEKNSWHQWSKDGCFYYFNNFRIPSDDYNNLIIFKGSAGIAKDRKYAYVEDRNIYFNKEGKRILDTIDVETFTVIDNIRCKDKFGCINPYHGRDCNW